MDGIKITIYYQYEAINLKHTNLLKFTEFKSFLKAATVWAFTVVWVNEFQQIYATAREWELACIIIANSFDDFVIMPPSYISCLYPKGV